MSLGINQQKSAEKSIRYRIIKFEYYSLQELEQKYINKSGKINKEKPTAVKPQICPLFGDVRFSEVLVKIFNF